MAPLFVEPNENMRYDTWKKYHIFSARLLTKTTLYAMIYSVAPVAQLAEHLTFNQRVRSSSLRRSTKKQESTLVVLSCFLVLLLNSSCVFRVLWLFFCACACIKGRNAQSRQEMFMQTYNYSKMI